jgi:hypothetical protein
MLYLTDADVKIMFQKARAGLKPDGLVFVKENVCKEGFVVDNDDSSLTRSNAYMLELFESAGMRLLQSVKQRNFPQDLFDVRREPAPAMILLELCPVLSLSVYHDLNDDSTLPEQDVRAEALRIKPRSAGAFRYFNHYVTIVGL